MSGAAPAPGQDRDVVEEVDRLIGALQSHPDAQVREQVSALLAGIDAVHRTALTRLMAAIHGMAGEAFINRLVSDPAIRFLLMSYDLLAVDRRLQAEEALDRVRGHLHAHGVDVEILEVVGGVVYVRLHGVERGTVPLEAVVRDVETALREGLLGFQELVPRDRPGVAPSTLIPLDSLRRAHRPVYHRSLEVADLPTGAVRGVEIEGHPVLLANVGGEVHAVRNRCGQSPLPLEFGVLQGAELRCSWHGCRYDVRSGRRLDGEGDRLPVYPVKLEDGGVHVAMGLEPAAAERAR